MPRERSALLFGNWVALSRRGDPVVATRHQERKPTRWSAGCGRPRELGPGYAVRRRSEARTRARNCSGVSAGAAGAAFCFTTAAVFAALRTARSASRLIGSRRCSRLTLAQQIVATRIVLHHNDKTDRCAPG
jgi:hypothetical protein